MIVVDVSQPLALTRSDALQYIGGCGFQNCGKYAMKKSRESREKTVSGNSPCFTEVPKVVFIYLFEVVVHGQDLLVFSGVAGPRCGVWREILPTNTWFAI
jgi:hypothetical protein